MIRKDFTRVCLGLAFSLVCAGAFAQTRETSSSGVLLDRVAATVNEGVVLQSELDEQMIIIAGRMRTQNVELPPQNVMPCPWLEGSASWPTRFAASTGRWFAMACERCISCHACFWLCFSVSRS